MLALAAAVAIDLAVHVALGADGAPVADAAWIEAQVGAAAAHLDDAEVTLTWHDAGDDGIAADIVTVKDRNALAVDAADDGDVHVFVVARLADKDLEGNWLNGVHWRYGGKRRGLRGRRYVILSRETRWSSTLAHELGHFFGLGHTDNEDGLMTTGPARGTGEPYLDEAQLATVRARARRWVRKHRSKQTRKSG